MFELFTRRGETLIITTLGWVSRGAPRRGTFHGDATDTRTCAPDRSSPKRPPETFLGSTHANHGCRHRGPRARGGGARRGEIFPRARVRREGVHRAQGRAQPRAPAWLQARGALARCESARTDPSRKVWRREGAGSTLASRRGAATPRRGRSHTIGINSPFREPSSDRIIPIPAPTPGASPQPHRALLRGGR